MSGWLLYHGQSESYPRTCPKMRLRQDYFSVADDSYSIGPNHIRTLIFIGDSQS